MASQLFESKCNQNTDVEVEALPNFTNHGEL